jgi:hypothetical protein
MMSAARPLSGVNAGQGSRRALTASGHSHFSRWARILAIKPKPDLNAEDLSIIVVCDVLNNQERHHEHGHSGSDIKRDPGTADRSALPGNRAHQQAKSDW